jgi:hypothetical protein
MVMTRVLGKGGNAQKLDLKRGDMSFGKAGLRILLFVSG